MAPDFRAVERFAPDFLAPARFAVGLRVVDFFAVDLRAVDLCAVDFFAVERFAVARLVVARLAPDFRAEDFRAEDFFAPRLLGGGGTFSPFSRASESPMAIACSRLFTRPPCPYLPLFKVPRFWRWSALPTVLLAARLYFRPVDFLAAMRPSRVWVACRVRLVQRWADVPGRPGTASDATLIPPAPRAHAPA